MSGLLRVGFALDHLVSFCVREQGAIKNIIFSSQEDVTSVVQNKLNQCANWLVGGDRSFENGCDLLTIGAMVMTPFSTALLVQEIVFALRCLRDDKVDMQLVSSVVMITGLMSQAPAIVAVGLAARAAFLVMNHKEIFSQEGVNWKYYTNLIDQGRVDDLIQDRVVTDLFRASVCGLSFLYFW